MFVRSGLRAPFEIKESKECLSPKKLLSVHLCPYFAGLSPVDLNQGQD